MGDAAIFPPLSRLVPHAPPMCLLDAVETLDDEAITCRVTLRADAPFVVDGRAPALVSLEYMAQAVAAYAGLHAEGPPRIGFLVGVRALDLYVDTFAVGDRLAVRVRHVWSNEISGSFEGEVTRESVCVARAKLSVFIPPAEAA